MRTKEGPDGARAATRGARREAAIAREKRAHAWIGTEDDVLVALPESVSEDTLESRMREWERLCAGLAACGKTPRRTETGQAPG